MTVPHTATALSLAILITAMPTDSARAQTIRYVDDGAPGGNGLTWGTAFNDLQLALAAAAGGSVDEIWVAAGTYTPAEVGSTESGSFVLLDGLSIYGGFNGTEDSLNQRDPSANETILSGDINGDDDAGTNGWTSDNSLHVVTADGVGPTAVLDGFTITGGNANGGSIPHYFGGGMYNTNYSSPTVTKCTFSGNSAVLGGGMYNEWYSNPVVTNCTFIGNSATNGGGGIGNYASDPTLTNCTFTGNSADDGGGMYNSVSNPTLTNCAFSGNSASYGGGMYSSGSNGTLTNCTFNENTATFGGGMWNSSDGPTLTNCTFSRNTATFGGGMGNTNGSSPTLTNCTFSGNSASSSSSTWTGLGGGMYSSGSNGTLTSCVFTGNSADDDGGGMYNFIANWTLTDCTFTGNSADDDGGGMYNSASNLTLTNCAFSGNSATYFGGGMYNNTNSNPTLTNCTFSGNSATDGAAVACDSDMQQWPSTVEMANCILWDGGNEIWNNDGSTITVTYSGVESGWPGTGNIDADPLFVDPGYWDDNGTPGDPADDFWVDGDYHLQSGSPCINTGSDYASELPEYDSEGEPRVQQCRVDMGADETPYTPTPFPDCNTDGLDDDCQVYDGTSDDCNQNHVPDECELEENDCNTSGTPDDCEPDSDGDGVIDDCDNCPTIENPDQQDIDTDGIGDDCDDDIDGDGVGDDVDGNGIPGENPCTGGQTQGCDDNCPTMDNPGQEDGNGDGMGDACDGDGDGVSEDGGGNGTPGDQPCTGGQTEGCDDNCPGIENPDQADADADGVGGLCDNCQLFNPDQADCQPNGIGDVCDIADGAGDRNADGVPDVCQLETNVSQQSLP